MSDIPDGLMAGGRHLWLALLARDASLEDDSNPALAIALEACRTKDRCDLLASRVAAVDVVVDNGKGQAIAHPAWTESRQQAIMLHQLITSLRLPNTATGKRPQFRGPRGTYRPRGIGSAWRPR
jgi:hypothetical protein